MLKVGQTVVLLPAKIEEMELDVKFHQELSSPAKTIEILVASWSPVLANKKHEFFDKL